MADESETAFTVDASRILAYVRSYDGATRLEIKNELGMGRGAVTQRLGGLMGAGLLNESGYVPSTGGRAPRGYSFAKSAGYVLAATLGITGFRVAVADLSGSVLASRSEQLSIDRGPEMVLDAVVSGLRQLIARNEIREDLVWGIGMSLPGPVEFQTGRAVAPTSMPGWDEYPVREALEAAFEVPCWIDNDVNMMALGELRALRSRVDLDLLAIKVSTGVGSGLISSGRIHRGAQGGAGDIGHIRVSDDPAIVCVCGNIGCLGHVAGGVGIARAGTEAAALGSSPYLARVLKDSGRVAYQDVVAGAGVSDAQCIRILSDSGYTIGETVATLVNFFNPAIVVLGGAVAEGSELIAQRVREAVYSRCLPLTTRHLEIFTSRLGHDAGVVGLANMVVDELLAPAAFRQWFGADDVSARPRLGAVGRELVST